MKLTSPPTMVVAPVVPKPSAACRGIAALQKPCGAHGRTASADSALSRKSSPNHTGACGNVSIDGRIEALLSHQNLLMQRQLELSEKQHNALCVAKAQYRTPREFLKTIDPCVRGIFQEWQGEFLRKMKMFVAQSRVCQKYTKDCANSNLMKPFHDEAQRTWPWSKFYQEVAKPIPGIDSTSPIEPEPQYAKSDIDIHDSSAAETYDVVAALADIRHRHAQEVQQFVVAHQNAWLNELVEETSLDKQQHNLQKKLSEWAEEPSSRCELSLKAYLEHEANKFVEMVHRDEMLKAESKIREADLMPIAVWIGMRILLVISFCLVGIYLGHEFFMHCFAILFALCCGIALVWEDLIGSWFQLLLVGTRMRLSSLRMQSQRLFAVATSPTW